MMNLNCINFIDSNTGIISGNEILKTTDGGNSWNSIFSQEVKSVSFKDYNTIYAVTSDGNIHISEDGGVSWIINCDNPINCTTVIFNNSIRYVGTKRSYNNPPLTGEPIEIMKK